MPVYVGQSKDGIRNRVARHLTSARSDIIANRQIDVWEVAYVWAYPVVTRDEIGPLEALLYHRFNPQSQLMNGQVPAPPIRRVRRVPEPAQKVQVMSNSEIEEKRDPVQRLPRQAGHYAQIVGHFLAVKESKQIAHAISVHFQRLAKYHETLLSIAVNEGTDDDESE